MLFCFYIMINFYVMTTIRTASNRTATQPNPTMTFMIFFGGGGGLGGFLKHNVDIRAVIAVIH